MNALNIMHLLAEINRNTKIMISSNKNKHVDNIFISTDDFDFSVFECGTCILTYKQYSKSTEKDIEYWWKVKDWVKKYYRESF